MAVQIMHPRSTYDRECIYRFLYDIWSTEFSRTMEGMDHQNRLMKDSLDDTAHHLFAVASSGQIGGCIRVNIVQRTALSENLRTWLKTWELTDLFGEENICYISHFAVSADARGKTVASLLISALYRFCLEKNLLVAVSYCAPPLVAFYYQLGYRPYTKNFRIDAGIRIPIVHCVRDRKYLHQIQSPLARLCPDDFDDRGEVAGKMMQRFPVFRTPGFSRTQVHRLWARLAHAIPSEATDRRSLLFDDLSPEELRRIENLLSEITFSHGEYVCRRGETEQWMGVLLSGSIGVEVSVNDAPRIASIISPGEPFGLIGSLGRGRRAASLVALEDSQAFLFPADFLERICRTDSALGFKLAKRLLQTVAARFSDLTETTVRKSGIGDRVCVKPAVMYQPVSSDREIAPIESYGFKSLGNRDDELKRLIAQATVGEEMEFTALENVGLLDGKRILDLGSGPGITSLLMARRLPSATIIGVEPENLLRVRAEALLEDQGFGGRCRFLKGTGEKIPLADGYVAFAYARLLFQHLPNPVEVLREMKRVTCPGGTIAVLDVDDRTNILFPAPEGLPEMEKRIAMAQAAAGGDRHVGRKLFGYLHDIGLREIGVELVPITASTFGAENYYAIVYGFKRQVLQRAGQFDDKAAELFVAIEASLRKPETFATTTVFLAHGVVP